MALPTDEACSTAQPPTRSYYVDTNRPPLGVGAYGTVYHGYDTTSAESVAVKLIVKGALSPADMAAMRHEAAMMRQVGSHPNVQRLLDVGEDSLNVYLVSPVVLGGDLNDAIEFGPTYDEATARELLRNLLSGIAHMHACGVMHRDIKLENVLLHQSWNLSTPSVHPVLSDFGFATDELVTGTFCGTPYYLPPEVIAAARDKTKQTTYDKKCDVWSFGVLAYTLLNAGARPFPGASTEECVALITRNAPDWRALSYGAQDFVQSLLTSDPAARPSAAEALQHPWLASHDAVDAKRALLLDWSTEAPSTELPWMLSTASTVALEANASASGSVIVDWYPDDASNVSAATVPQRLTHVAVAVHDSPTDAVQQQCVA